MIEVAVRSPVFTIRYAKTYQLSHHADHHTTSRLIWIPLLAEDINSQDVLEMWKLRLYRSSLLLMSIISVRSLPGQREAEVAQVGYPAESTPKSMYEYDGDFHVDGST